MKKICFLILLINTSLVVSGQRNLIGYYSSNIPEIGFFVERLQLNPDSTFQFEFRGDMEYYRGTGKYQAVKRIVYLKYDPVKIDLTDSIQVQHALDTLHRSYKYFLKNGKLWSFHVDGYVVKKGQAMSRHRKYLIFGDYYMTDRTMFLKKRKGNKINR